MSDLSSLKHELSSKEMGFFRAHNYYNQLVNLGVMSIIWEIFRILSPQNQFFFFCAESLGVPMFIRRWKNTNTQQLPCAANYGSLIYYLAAALFCMKLRLKTQAFTLSARSNSFTLVAAHRLVLVVVILLIWFVIQSARCLDCF